MIGCAGVFVHAALISASELTGRDRSVRGWDLAGATEILVFLVFPFPAQTEACLSRQTLDIRVDG